MKTAIPLSPLLIPLSFFSLHAISFLFSLLCWLIFPLPQYLALLSLGALGLALLLSHSALLLILSHFSESSCTLPLLSFLAHSCFFLSSPSLSLSLFPLGSVPAPLPWHWANSSPPLRLLPFLYTPCLWLMAPLFWKERKGNRERGRARGKGSSKAHRNIKTAHTEARKAHTCTHIPTEL